MLIIEALRQCIEAMKLVDFKDCGESEALWKQINDAQANAERVLREGPDAENLFRHAVYSAGMEFAAALCDFSIVHMIKGRDYIDRDSAMALVAKWRYKVDQASKAYRDAAVLRDGEKQEPVAYLRFRAAQQWSGSGNSDIEYSEWLETCHAHEIGDDKLPAFPVYAAQQPADAPSGDAWISVNDRLPEKYEEVMVFPWPTDYCMTAERDDKGFYYGEYVHNHGHENERIAPGRITHWMPLPNPPATKE